MKWPSRELFYWYLGLSLLLDILFVVVYGGSNWLNGQRSEHFLLYFAWELQMPLWPGMIFPYMSIGLLFLLPLFTLSRQQMVGLAKRMACAIMIAGLFFNLLPTELGFERTAQHSVVDPLFRLVFLLDRPFNLFPSLHVTLSSLVTWALLAGAGARARLVYSIWWLLLCLSVVFVHQHHLADIGGGLALAWAVHYSLSRAEVPTAVAG